MNDYYSERQIELLIMEQEYHRYFESMRVQTDTSGSVPFSLFTENIEGESPWMNVSK